MSDSERNSQAGRPITPEELISKAREWLDTPFHHQGRVKGVGVDCIGVLVGVMREFGIQLPDHYHYPREPYGILEKKLDLHLERTDRQIGAVALFRIRNAPQHVAIITDKGMIHSYSPIKKTVETVIDEKWERRFLWCYALPGVKYGG